MHQAPAFLLTALVTLGPNSLPAQTKTTVHIRISARETCLIGNLDVSCSNVGAKLRELGTPLDADIHLSGETHVSYRVASTAMDSLRRAGFKLKMGLITEDDHAH
jgi:biopolymer transport protein ExbD